MKHKTLMVLIHLFTKSLDSILRITNLLGDKAYNKRLFPQIQQKIQD